LQHNIKKDIYLIISQNIKKYRKKENLTQKELAKKCGYSYAYIRRIEGPNCPKNFSILTISNICESLNIEISSIFKDNDI
jgi:transcriptional regulator with XRE-family HTH domain